MYIYGILSIIEMNTHNPIQYKRDNKNTCIEYQMAIQLYISTGICFLRGGGTSIFLPDGWGEPEIFSDVKRGNMKKCEEKQLKILHSPLP